MYLDSKFSGCVCVCTYARVPGVLSSCLLCFYERMGSERAADVEALTFLVAAAWARVKRHPAPESSASASTCTDSPARTLLPQVAG